MGIIFSPKVAEIALKPAVVIQKKRNLRKVIIFYLENYLKYLEIDWEKKNTVALVIHYNPHRLS